MKNAQLTALALACTFVLTGCGGGSSESSGTNGGSTIVVPTMTDLEKAKDLVQTAHLIVTDAQNIRAAYTPVLESLNNPAVEGLNNTLGFIADLQSGAFNYGVSDNVSDSLTGSDIDNEFNSNDNPYWVTAAPNAKISVNQNGDFVLNGDFKIKELEYQEYDYKTGGIINRYKPEVSFYANNVMVTGGNVDTVSKVFTSTIANQGSVTVTAGLQKASLSFVGTGINTVTETYTSAKSYRNRMIDWNNAESYDINTEADKIVIDLNGATLTTTNPAATIAANMFKLTLEKKEMSVANTNNVATAQKIKNIVPTSLQLTGQFKMPTPNTDLELNVKIDLDPTSQLMVDANNSDTVENDTHFAKGTFFVGLKGSTFVDNKTIPLDLQLTGKRADYLAVEATNIVIKVNNRTLNATAVSMRHVDLPTTTFTLNSGNGASTTFTLDDDSNPVGSIDVKVAGLTYGTISKQSSGLFVARFNDNSIIAL